MHPIDEAFFRAYERAHRPLRIFRTASRPEDMMLGPVDAHGYCEWCFKPCTTSLDPIFSQYACAAGKELPPSFQRWYASMFTLDLDCSIIRLPINPSNAPGTGLLRQIMPESPWWTRPLELGLLPFGNDGNDEGPLCFDTRNGGDPDHWPITFWVHDDPQAEIGPVLFSSFDALLQGCTAYLECLANLQACAAQDDPWQDRICECFAPLMAADPQGAGTAGKEYWESIAMMRLAIHAPPQPFKAWIRKLTYAITTPRRPPDPWVRKLVYALAVTAVVATIVGTVALLLQ